MITEGRPAMATTTELAFRREGGIDVALFWDKATGALSVLVVDLASGDAFELPVASDQALDSFYHPYAHAAFKGVQYRLEAAPVPAVGEEVEELLHRWY
jgi:hypothetical protein